MSALGQKRTCAAHKPMSALPPIATGKADIGAAGNSRRIYFTPIFRLWPATRTADGTF
jgi:hypothetical protein